MIRNIAILTFNDLAIAFKNKTLYLVLFLPLFVFLTMTLVDAGDPGVQKMNIGLLDNEKYPAEMIRGLRSADHALAVSWLPNKEDAKRWLREKHGDGVLVPSGTDSESVTLIVAERASLKTVAIVESFSELQRVLEGRSRNWISEIHSLYESAIQKQMLPTWILMLLLTVSFIVLPAQVAEEKEKKLLLGLLQTPIREVEWLLAKVCLGMILTGVAALFLQLLMRFDFNLVGGLSYFAFLMVGGFSFSAFGVFVGFLCRTQASARTLGVLFYLPHLLPSALSDFSQQLNAVAPLIPSYPFYGPIKSILLEDASVLDFPLEWIALFGIGLFTTFLSHRLMEKRWLM
jgi:ABC-2 type transport system permease protein